MFRGLISQREARDSHGSKIDILEASYVKFFEKIGVVLQPVSNFISDIDYLFDEITVDVIILSGGGDVAPSYYRKYFKEAEQPNRDIIERKLITLAIKRDIPVIGICRGMQHLNGIYNGKISNLEQIGKNRPNGQDHKIEIGTKKIYVNNYHNDGILIDDLSKDFSMIALDSEHKLVEGFLCEKHKILGIQWHPERVFEDYESYQYSEALIKSFIANGGKLNESYYFSSRTRD